MPKMHSMTRNDSKPGASSQVTSRIISAGSSKSGSNRSLGTVKRKSKSTKILYCLGLTKYRVIRKVCASFSGWSECENEEDDWDLVDIVGRKSYLGRNLQRMKTYYPKEYKYFPSTWILPTDAASLRAKFADKKRKTFIVKPECGSQGRGIFLTQNLNDIDFNEHLVVQRYIQKPYLLDGLKFDLRLYLLLAGCSPLRLFLHKDGLVRFATHKYQPPNVRNCGNLRMHLTNYAINKSSSQFQPCTDPQDAQDGHKRSLYHVMERLRREGKDVDAINNKISDMLVKTIISIQPSLAHIYTSCQADDASNSMCFEIFGVDVVLDSQLEPWLIEVNHSPSFATDSALDKQVKFAVIKDALTLVGVSKKNKKKFLAAQKSVIERNIAAVHTPVAKRNRQLERDKAKAECAQQRTEWEDKHLGGYKRIYPTPDGGAKYVHLFEAAKEIWGNSTGVTRTRPILESLLQARRTLSNESQSAMSDAAKQPTLPGHSRRKSLVPICGNTGCSSKTNCVAEASNSSLASSSGLNQLKFSQRATRRKEGEGTTTASTPTPLPATAPLPPLPSSRQPERTPCRQLLAARQNRMAGQRPLGSHYFPLSGSLLTSSVQYANLCSTSSFKLYNNPDAVAASQTTARTSFCLRDTAASSSLDLSDSLAGLSSETLGCSHSLLSSSFSGRNMASMLQPNTISHTRKTQQTGGLVQGSTDSMSVASAQDTASRSRSVANTRPPLRLPRIELSLNMQQSKTSGGPRQLFHPLQSQKATHFNRIPKATRARRSVSVVGNISSN